MKTLLLVFIKFTTFKYLMYEEGNRYEKFYPKNTTYKGQITYLLTCPDGIPMAYSNSATIPLATK